MLLYVPNGHYIDKNFCYGAICQGLQNAVPGKSEKHGRILKSCGDNYLFDKIGYSYLTR